MINFIKPFSTARWQTACCSVICLAAIAANASSIHVRVTDDSNRPLPHARVDLVTESAVIKSVQTNDQGEADLNNLAIGTYELSVEKDGFRTASQKHLVLRDASLSIEVSLSAKIAVKEEISVAATSESPLEKVSSPGTEMQRLEMKTMPGNPGTVAETLPLVPGVVRSPNGEIQISGMGEHHSTFLVNSADTTDPVTGQFGLTLPIDSVETMSVLKTPYLAQYGRFTAGVVSIDTRRGGEKWNFEINDPVPEFRIRSGHLEGLREFTPRATLGGPLLKNKLYFAEGFTYDIEKHAVRTLQFPFNESKQQYFNSFTQMDWIESATHIVTASLHVAPNDLKYARLGFFDPQPVTPNFNTQNYTATVIDRMTLRLGLLQSTLSSTKVQAEIMSQGRKNMILTPTGNRGNYFNQQDRRAIRGEWLESLSLNPIHAAGVHNLQFGSALTISRARIFVSNHAIDVLSNANELIEKIRFTPSRPSQVHDSEAAVYAQDHWVATSKLAFDAGLRLGQQRLTRTLRLAPRVGFQFQPWHDPITVIRGGYGLFYDRVPLNVFSYEQWPEETITRYLPDSFVDGPRLFAHRMRASKPKRLVIVHARKGFSADFAPSSAAWNIELEQKVSRALSLRAGYSEDNSDSLITLLSERIPGGDALSLHDLGRSRYRQMELNSRMRWKIGDLSLSYVHSKARGDLNEFDTFLGSFPAPLVPQNRFSTLPTDLPNRVLLFGQFKLPQKIRLTPLVEYRNGFPYQVRDVFQNFVATANSPRFPDYFSLDGRIAKDFQVTRKYSLTVAISATNLSNHFNALAVHANQADPQFGRFFGSYLRRARLDFDVNF